MKKLILLLLFVPLVSFGQTKFANLIYQETYGEYFPFYEYLFLFAGIIIAIALIFGPNSPIKKAKTKEDEFKTNIVFVTFIEKMKEIPDWYKIIQARGNAHDMIARSMSIGVDDYDYWANAHKEEYMMKYNDGNLDVEGVKLRIEKFGYIASELEKVIKKAAELKLNTTPEMHNDYCAARASVLGAEYALKEMSS